MNTSNHKAPSWLNRIAKSYWAKLVNHVEPLTEGKVLQLTLLCDGLAQLRQASAILDKDGVVSHRGIIAKKAAIEQIQKAYKLLGLHKANPEDTPLDELDDLIGA